MTSRLEEAFRAAAKLPPDEQDALAEVILAEVEGADAEWDDRFAKSADKLSRLAEEALEEHRRGQTRPLRPDDI